MSDIVIFAILALLLFFIVRNTMSEDFSERIVYKRVIPGYKPKIHHTNATNTTKSVKPVKQVSEPVPHDVSMSSEPLIL